MRWLGKMTVILPLFLSILLYAHGTNVLQIKDLNGTKSLLPPSSEIEKPSFCEKQKNWLPTSLVNKTHATEHFCFERCFAGETCEENHKCVSITLFPKRCLRTCSVDDECEYPMKCAQIPKGLTSVWKEEHEEKFCYWKQCTVDDDCEFPMTCVYTFLGRICLRRLCLKFNRPDCGYREKCHPVAKGCQCADGMSGSNCKVEEWCQDNGKFKNCKGENGTCKYSEILREVICKCSSRKKLHPEENRCRETCTNSTECKNGGVCETKGVFKFCSCKLGIIGDLCETVFDCTPDGKYKDCEKNGGKCSYDGKKAICECSGKRKLNDKEFICEACDCGAQGVCRFVNGQKTCDCEQGSIEIDGTCRDSCMPNPCKNDGKCETNRQGFKCNCTGAWRGKTCETACICRGGECVLEGGKGVCKCPLGFGNFTNTTCKACDCGPDISCIWEARFGGSKICLCKPGYSTKNGKCAACECGPGSNCEWISERWLESEKICHCKPGYHEEEGKCVDGTETSSSRGTTKSISLSTIFSSTAQDTETTSSRHTTESFIVSTPLSSTVQDCHCGSFSYSCSLDSSGNKVCRCFMGYSQLDGSCAECNCGPSGICTFENKLKKCKCRSSATQINGNCVDKQDLRTFFLNLLDKFP